MMPMIETPVPWPNKARVACCFSFDMDADSILHIAFPEDAAQKVACMTMLRYGPEIAVPRICKLFEGFGMKITFFIPAWCIEEHPRAVERILKGGHEVAHHGYLHEQPNLHTRDRELYWTSRAFEVIERFTGKKPRGYRAPLYMFSKHTTEILANLGIEYDTSLMGDDVPYLLRGRSGGELVELPGFWSMDDWPHYMHSIEMDYMMPISAPEHAAEVYMSEFEAAWEYGGFWQTIWHPFLSGRPPRLRQVEKMLEAMHKKGRVWFPTMEECARHIRKMVDSGKYKPRVVEMPIKEGRIAQLAEETVPHHG